MSVGQTSTAAVQGAAAFAWLHAQAPPSDWTRASIPDGAVLPIPPGWKRESGDANTATAVLRDSNGQLIGYLNATPRENAEAPATWAAFRVHHNAGEGDSNVREEAAAQGLHFRGGRGSCVKDRYETITQEEYIELACLLAGAKTSAVIVAAAPPDSWAQLAPRLERAVSSFSA